MAVVEAALATALHCCPRCPNDGHDNGDFADVHNGRGLGRLRAMEIYRHDEIYGAITVMKPYGRRCYQTLPAKRAISCQLFIKGARTLRKI